MSKAGRVDSDADPNVVTVLRKYQPPIKTLRSDAALSLAQRKGLEIETNKKYTAGQNKQHTVQKNTAVLDRETEELHIDRVPLSMGKVIQQARQGKEWTQKDLGTHVNEKAEVIRDYENGKAVPNANILAKMERALGVKLRGKDLGQPFVVKSVSSSNAVAVPMKKKK